MSPMECEIHHCREHGRKRDLHRRCRDCETCDPGVEPQEQCPRCHCRTDDEYLREEEIVCIDCFLPRVPLTKTRFCKRVARFINRQNALGSLPIYFEIMDSSIDGNFYLVTRFP